MPNHFKASSTANKNLMQQLESVERNINLLNVNKEQNQPKTDARITETALNTSRLIFSNLQYPLRNRTIKPQFANIDNQETR